MVELKLLVDEKLYKYIVERGFAEITTRGLHKRISAIPKAMIASEQGIGKDAADKLLNAISPNVEIERLRKTLGNISNNTSVLCDSVKNMSLNIDTLAKNVNVSKSLSYLNVGLELANLAVSATGFVVVVSKLNTLTNSIRELDEKINGFGNALVNEKIGDYQNLVMRSNTILSKAGTGADLSWEEIENLLCDMRPFISQMIKNFVDSALNSEVILNVINLLMPTYTLLSLEYIGRCYFDKGIEPPNYGMILSLYDEILCESVRKSLLDYFMLEKKMSNLEAVDTMMTEIAIWAQEKNDLEDQLITVKELKTRERYDEYNRELDELAKNYICEAIDEMDVDLGMDKQTLKTLVAVKIPCTR